MLVFKKININISTKISPVGHYLEVLSCDVLGTPPQYKETT